MPMCRLDTIAPNRLLRVGNRVCMACQSVEPYVSLATQSTWECVSQHRLSLSGRTPLLSVHSFGGLVPTNPLRDVACIKPHNFKPLWWAATFLILISLCDYKIIVKLALIGLILSLTTVTATS